MGVKMKRENATKRGHNFQAFCKCCIRNVIFIAESFIEKIRENFDEIIKFRKNLPPLVNFDEIVLKEKHDAKYLKVIKKTSGMHSLIDSEK